MRKINFSCSTDGKGHWSRIAKSIRLKGMYVPWFEPDLSYCELRVKFNRADWKVKTDGYIYTDKQFLAEFRQRLQDIGFTRAATDSVHYSELGMQEVDYVSFDAGSDFLCEAILHGFVDEKDGVTY